MAVVAREVSEGPLSSFSSAMAPREGGEGNRAAGGRRSGATSCITRDSILVEGTLQSTGVEDMAEVFALNPGLRSIPYVAVGDDLDTLASSLARMNFPCKSLQSSSAPPSALMQLALSSRPWMEMAPVSWRAYLVYVQT